VTLATILAVVAGLLIAASSNVAYDLYSRVVRKGEGDDHSEVRVAKIATVLVGAAAIILALATQTLNVAFLASLAFAVAASANFPVIIYSIYWKRFNTAGAVAALLVGLFSAVGLVLVGPAIIGPKGLIMPAAHPLINLTNPGIISIPLGFIAGWLGTILAGAESLSEHRFDIFKVRSLTGYGAEQSDRPH
jgi:cation/acetate symporter